MGKRHVTEDELTRTGIGQDSAIPTVKSTVGATLPSFAGRAAGDIHRKETQYTLTGTPGITGTEAWEGVNGAPLGSFTVGNTTYTWQGVPNALHRDGDGTIGTLTDGSSSGKPYIAVAGADVSGIGASVVVFKSNQHSAGVILRGQFAAVHDAQNAQLSIRVNDYTFMNHLEDLSLSNIPGYVAIANGGQLLVSLELDAPASDGSVFMTATLTDPVANAVIATLTHTAASSSFPSAAQAIVGLYTEFYTQMGAFTFYSLGTLAWEESSPQATAPGSSHDNPVPGTGLFIKSADGTHTFQITFNNGGGMIVADVT